MVINDKAVIGSATKFLLDYVLTTHRPARIII